MICFASETGLFSYTPPGETGNDTSGWQRQKPGSDFFTRNRTSLYSYLRSLLFPAVPVVFLLLLLPSGAGAQGLIRPETIPADTTFLFRDTVTAGKLIYSEFLNGEPVFSLPRSLLRPDFAGFNGFNLSGQPVISADLFHPGTLSLSHSAIFLPGVFYPHLHSGTLFNEAAWKLNDRFLLGGSSFGMKSVFTAPFPNQGLNHYDFRGASMFMQYKVSKNFKIETRVTVTNRDF